MNESMKDLCKLVSGTFELSTFFIDRSGEVLFECIHNDVLNPLYQSKKQKLFDLLNFKPQQEFEFPVIRQTSLFENFICMSVRQHNRFEGTLIIGPTIFYRLSHEDINGLINDYAVSAHKKNVFHYYESVRVVKMDKLVTFSLMIYYTFYQKLLSAEKILHEVNEMEQGPVHVNNPDLEVSKRLQNVSLHHDPLLEKRFFNNIKEGRLEEVKKFLQALREKEPGPLSKSSFLRSRKNLAIATITMATRSSIDGGLHSEVAFTLSDTFIQRVEELSEVKDLNHLVEEVVYTFTERVAKVKEQRYSKPITLCQHYIFSHIYEEITHDELSAAVNLSPSYLSVLFKKEVGISVSEYIQRTKIDEAKKLLTYTEKPLSEICSFLHFTDQSYFTKVFKKVTGVTPKQFRTISDK
ncbi:AraC family transcriptional regulator [Gracilibacillus sp. S3-1-1]|uniref:AraC family transcriptional regulator n=1 Tax=Gracilibacillus pellucidus TaxID=3095368 RepID=A0ACC6M366_9BACI|nr:helix-turn-helix domain-containing protein [Gracilibacillus sp. S3-1-1]MDX8045399.1 AraC family transcriptional regulator [Gracilibacillus sp. S3-1-1]